MRLKPLPVAVLAFVLLAFILYGLRKLAEAGAALMPAGATEAGALGIAWTVLTWAVLPLASGFLALLVAIRFARKGEVLRVLARYLQLVSIGAPLYVVMAVLLMDKTMAPDVLAIAAQALFAGAAGTIWAVRERRRASAA